MEEREAAEECAGGAGCRRHRRRPPTRGEPDSRPEDGACAGRCGGSRCAPDQVSAGPGCSRGGRAPTLAAAAGRGAGVAGDAPRLGDSRYGRCGAGGQQRVGRRTAPRLAASEPRDHPSPPAPIRAGSKLETRGGGGELGGSLSRSLPASELLSRLETLRSPHLHQLSKPGLHSESGGGPS